MSGSLTQSRLPSITATNLFLRKQLWIWPLAAAVLLAGLAWWVRGSVEGTLRQSIAGQLQTVLDADTTALDIWFQSQTSTARAVADDPEVRSLVEQLTQGARNLPADELRTQLAEPIRRLRAQMRPYLDAHGYQGFVLAGADERILVSSHDELIGQNVPNDYLPMLATVMAGRPTMSRPFPSTIGLPDSHGNVRAGVPTMFAAAPVRDQQGAAMALLGLRIRPEVDFTRILTVARMGQTGETYALSPQGVFLSESRFDSQLKELGLIPDREDSQSIFNLQARNPQVDITRGARPTVRRAEQPLTRPAQGIADGESGVDIDGYRDYRGVPSIGAWKWLPDRGFGVVTELDTAESLHSLHLVQLAFWCLLGLLLLAALAIFAYSVVVARLARQARKSALELKRLGQYVLEQKIGSGGMGDVYRAHHAMLRRATAVKLIDPEKTTELAIKRFEREVQLTSQLNHPNTIAIYDFGRTPEGVFYYAMELLDGLTLQSLVERFGPQPEQRVVNVLRQVCGSLIEAHEAGLIHRDIKPANIMLNQRGGLSDFVKLLDFGLVKAVDSHRQAALTMMQGLTGTPLYMPPEAIEDAQLVDGRSDLYALGAVGYFLLTGKPVFEGRTVMEICMHQVESPVVPPSQRLGKPISPGLESVLLGCLAKAQNDRPATARELLEQLAACQVAADWSDASATDWWWRYRHAALATTELPTHSGRQEQTIDL